MCDLIATRLATGEPLDDTQRAHIQTCARCAAAAVVVRDWRPRRVSGAVPELPRTRTLARRRVIVRGAVFAMALAAIFLAWPRPQPEPDLMAALDDVDALLGPDGSGDLDDLLDDPVDDFDPLGDL